MTIISRLLLDHPALGTTGGAGLHTSIESIYTKLGDSVDSRFFTQNALANSANVDFEHNFKTAFSTLRYDLYIRDTGTGELTLVTDASTPALSSFTIAATPSFTTTKIRVTNSSGAARDIALVVRHVDLNASKLEQVTLSVNSNVSLKFGRVHLVDTTSARTLTLPDPSLSKSIIVVKDATGSAGTNVITIARFGSEQIEGAAASYSLDYDRGSLGLVSDGTNWHVI
jgi:hypothetical protein